MAIKLKSGATVPTLQPGEPFFDGKALSVGKLDGSGAVKIGGAAIRVITIDDFDLDSNQFTITEPGIYVMTYGTYVEIDPISMSPNDYVKIFNVKGESIGSSCLTILGQPLDPYEYVEFLIVSVSGRDIEIPNPIIENRIVYLHASKYVGAAKTNGTNPN